MLRKELKLEYDKIKETFDSYIKGDIKVMDVKHVTAYYGVYNTRDEKFMTRVRKVGGEFTAQNLTDLAHIVKEKEVNFAHISTRDCIQLQGVPVPNVHDVITFCATHEMPFKGGGGNSYRNPLISPLSGISKESKFDVRPYAIQLDNHMKTFEKAFKLGRKIKIAFSAEDADLSNCAVNDLGFLAQIKDGVEGFKVYYGGGLGSAPAEGYVLYEFIEAKECIKIATAIVELFHDHGNRVKRSRARMRFLVEDLGEEGFKNLYEEYLEKTVIKEKYLTFENADYKEVIENLEKSTEEVSEEEKANFEAWKKVAVTPTRFENTSAVRLFIKHGNFKAEELLELVDVVEATGCDFIRLSAAQDLFLPLVDDSNIYSIYKLLDTKLVTQQAKNLKFEGHTITCIGATLCGIGLLDSVSIGKEVSEEIDRYFEDKAEIKKEVYAQLIDGIKISGCGSSCSTHQVSPLGFMGMKKLVDGTLTECLRVFTGGVCTADLVKLADTDATNVVTRADTPKFVTGIIADYLVEYKATKVTFEEFMKSYEVKL